MLLDERGRWPLVLVLTPDQPRAEALAGLIAAQNSPLCWALHPLPTLTNIGLFQAKWSVVQNGQISPMLIMAASQHVAGMK